MEFNNYRNMKTSNGMEKVDELYKIRHSLAHLLAAAVLEIYPDAKPTIGPVIENGFYYDFDLPAEALAKEGFLEKIENKMRQILKTWGKFEEKEVSAKEAKEFFKNNEYKLELIEDLEKDPTSQKLRGTSKITFYTSGEFTDLCVGGHVSDAKEIPSNSWKLERVAGAYWRGDEKNKMLTRIYGLAFESKEKLEEHLKNVEEAKKRDHRKLGKELKLFTISELVGAGLPMMQPKGMIIRKEIEDYLWQLHKNKGYQRVWTPHLAKKDLYETSGHAAKFGEELFRVKGGDEEFFMKPMNCPHHMQIFADNQFSYRDMPVRYFEPATVYRYEKAGQLAGLTRVRSITQDDGHLFCRVSQIGQEVSAITNIVKEFYTTLGMMSEYRVSLSVRGDDKSKYLGEDEVWNKAEKTLEDSAKENNLNYEIAKGEAAFYGPKLDFIFKDAIGREWQLATIQCDFNLPERFSLEFTNEKGERERPVVIHRAISGSLERFMALLIEHYAGAFPLWLSPVQIKVIPVRESHNDYAKEVYELLRKNDIRAEVDLADENLGKKVRATKNEKTPYWIVLGDKEVESKEVTLESRGKDGEGEKLGSFSLPNLLDLLKKEIKEKK